MYTNPESKLYHRINYCAHELYHYVGHTLQLLLNVSRIPFNDSETADHKYSKFKQETNHNT